MKQAIVASCVLAFLAGCGKNGTYELRDVPFCTVDDTSVRAELAHTYVLLTTHEGEVGDNDELVSASVLGGAPDDVRMYPTVSPGGMRLVVVRCDDSDVSFPQRLSKEVGSGLPFICDGQEPVVDRHLGMDSPSARDEALGVDGVYHFPAVDLECANGGRLRHRPDVTLGQILATIHGSVGAYADAHGALPESMLDLHAVHQPEVPPDPWGTPLDLRLGESDSFGRSVLVTSLGPDREYGTTDDILLLESTASSASWSTAYTTLESSHPDGDYRRFLKSRGID